jgi:hypothetical protein
LPQNPGDGIHIGELVWNPGAGFQLYPLRDAETRLAGSLVDRKAAAGGGVHERHGPEARRKEPEKGGGQNGVEVDERNKSYSYTHNLEQSPLSRDVPLFYEYLLIQRSTLIVILSWP